MIGNIESKDKHYVTQREQNKLHLVNFTERFSSKYQSFFYVNRAL